MGAKGPGSRPRGESKTHTLPGPSVRRGTAVATGGAGAEPCPHSPVARGAVRAGEAGGPVRGDPEVILWQSRARVAIVVLLGGAAAALMALGVLPGSLPILLASIVVYSAFVVGVRAWVARRRVAGAGVAAALVLG